MEIKVNDLVKLRKDLIKGKIYGKMDYLNEMNFDGFKRVTKVYLDGVFEIEDQSNINREIPAWNYTIEMLEEVKRPTYKTIYKKKSILDDTEKRYLSAVIKPFKDNVYKISKMAYSYDSEYICLRTYTAEHIHFPTFKKETMYKGMKCGKDYTLEELGL